MPGVPGAHPELLSVFPGTPEALETNRKLFVEWRYLQERPMAFTETSVLKGTLSAIIHTFEDPTPPPILKLRDARHG